jgi:HNH endonuclease
MTSIRSAHYPMISNGFAQDRRLSFQARGIVMFVLSRPPDRKFTAQWLEAQAPNGRIMVRSALRELEAADYYRSRRRSLGRGQWEWDQVISDASLESALPAAGPFIYVRPDVARDKRLSLQARGLYLFLVSLPPEAEPSLGWLTTQATNGKHAIRRALIELEACGYVRPTGISGLRASIPPKLRYQALRRDGFACRYCGARAPEAILVVDHLIPATLIYGPPKLANLVTACDTCNDGKSATMPEAWLIEEVRMVTVEWLAAMGPDADVCGEAPPMRKGRSSYYVEVCR